jgi:FKBP-type peptidyl-prolyl cis-trans isomerase
MGFAAVLAAVLAAEIPITEDRKVIKWILHEGEGASPGDNQTVMIQYVGALLDGTVFDASRSPFRFMLGRGVILGWSIGVVTMKVGEIADFSIHYEYGYGERGYPPMSPLLFRIELVSIE